MDGVGQEARETQDRAVARYFVVAGGDEKGPYTVEQLRLAVAETALSAESRVRAEDETKDRPLGPLLASVPRPEPKVRRRRRKRGDDSPETAHEVVAQLVEEEDEPPRGPDGFREDEGEFATGVIVGFFGGCIALAVSGQVKPQTRKGIYTGFAFGLFFAIVLQLVRGSAR